jgi:hypothetical protein
MLFAARRHCAGALCTLCGNTGIHGLEQVWT